MGPAIVKALGIIQKAGSSPKAKSLHEGYLKYQKELHDSRIPEWATKNLLKMRPQTHFVPSEKNPNKLIPLARKMIKK